MKNWLFSGYFVFLFIFCAAAGQRYTLSMAKSHYLSELSAQGGNKTATSFKMVSQWGKKEFVSGPEWIAFLRYCDEQAKPEKHEDYPELCFTIGTNLDLNGLPHEAFVYLIRVENLIAGKSPEEVPFFYEFHERLGLVYYSFQRYNLAKKHFLLLVKGKKTPVKQAISANNAVALIHRSQHADDSCRMYLERALDLAKKNEKKEWVGIVSGNLGDYYFRQNQLDRAGELVRIDYEISRSTEQWESAMNAVLLLAQIDMEQQLIDSAEQHIREAEDMMRLYYHTTRARMLYEQTAAHLNDLKGNFREAFRHQKLYQAYADSVNDKEKLEQFFNTEFQMEFQKKQSEIKLLDARKKRAEQLFQMTITVVCFVLLGVAIVLRQIILRKRKEKEVLVLRQLRMEDELGNIEGQMHLVLSNLSEKNELVYQLQAEVEQLYAVSSNGLPPEEKERLFDKLQTFKLLTEDDWDEFRKLFEKLHPGFFTHFQKLGEGLSKADLRLAALLRLNLSSAEIARALGISPESVKRTHLRLRNKLDLKQQKDLDELIRSI